jgi:hypothetical protein
MVMAETKGFELLYNTLVYIEKKDLILRDPHFNPQSYSRVPIQLLEGLLEMRTTAPDAI